ncbi:hypothetical protein [Flavihumibacter sp.]|uniref:hypothetical protein n=1 Tax=Flavihumibacter sp. TaxID=1913981 RepID=UPI002FCA280F
MTLPHRQTQTIFIIEDEAHAEPQKGEFQTFEDAFSELERRAKIPWNEIPNLCPCTNWEDCGRNYHIIEYDMTQAPWKELQRKEILTITAKEVKWSTDK